MSDQRATLEQSDQTQAKRIRLDSKALKGRRDVKVKLPAEQVLRLYYIKLTTSYTYSDVIEDALSRYFADMDPIGPAPDARDAVGL